MLEIKEVSSEIDYWFFRTDSGANFETYLNNDFIAIGWNYVTLHDLSVLTEAEIKEKLYRNLAQQFPEHDETSIRRKATDAYNKMIKFNQLRENDIIVIPSDSSNKLAFGKITSTNVYSEPSGKNACDYMKRREVKWLTEGLPIDTLDPIFYKIRKTQHTITKIEEENQYYIDSILYNVYQKKGRSHFVIKIGTTDPINLEALAGLLTSLYQIMNIVNHEFELNEAIEESSIRLNLQSPGLLNMSAGKALIYAALLLGATGCSTKSLPPADRQKMETLQHKNDSTISVARDRLNSLKGTY